MPHIFGHEPHIRIGLKIAVLFELDNLSRNLKGDLSILASKLSILFDTITEMALFCLEITRPTDNVTSSFKLLSRTTSGYEKSSTLGSLDRSNEPLDTRTSLAESSTLALVFAFMRMKN